LVYLKVVGSVVKTKGLYVAETNSELDGKILEVT